jgi:hypothetical protein
LGFNTGGLLVAGFNLNGLYPCLVSPFSAHITTILGNGGTGCKLVATMVANALYLNVAAHLVPLSAVKGALSIVKVI